MFGVGVFFSDVFQLNEESKDREKENRTKGSREIIWLKKLPGCCFKRKKFFAALNAASFSRDASML